MKSCLRMRRSAGSFVKGIEDAGFCYLTTNPSEQLLWPSHFVGRFRGGATRILLSLLVSASLHAATYYVDYSGGADANNGLSKSAPWKNAPGMFTCSGSCASTVVRPGDSIILKGGVTWPNASFPWYATFSGSASSPVYIGVDQTWYTGNAWTRPVLDLQQLGTNRGGFSALQEVINDTVGNYITWDNFEIVNWNTGPDTTQGNYAAELFAISGSTGGTIQNMYIHKWYNPYVSIGTGNLSTGSCTVTNYVPYSYSPAPSSAWTSVPGGVRMQSLPQGTNIPEGNSSPTVTAITGANPYSVSFTNNTGCSSVTKTGAVIQIGLDSGIVFSGNTAGDPGWVVQQNIVDGSDTLEASWNPYPDCGLSEGNNNACMASVTVARYGPQVFRNNVFRFVSNGFVGSSTEVGGNLLEYFRLGTDPTGHTNVWEDEPAFGNTNAYYNNVIHGMNFPNPNIPGGSGNIGVPLMVAPPSSSAQAFVFNNVLYDMTQNVVVEINALQGLVGTVNVFNNTILGGPSANAAYSVFSCTVPTCTVQNNHAITTAASALGACGAGCGQVTNMPMTPSTAAANGYNLSQSNVLSPNSPSSPTVGAGSVASPLCSGLGALPLAQAACSSATTYGVGYNILTHTVVVGSAVQRPSSGNWDIGAYQFSSTPTTQPGPPAITSVRITSP